MKKKVKRPAKKIVIANHKGGVAKTTTVINMAYGLNHEGFKVLMVDFDPQANLSYTLGISEISDDNTLENVMRAFIQEGSGDVGQVIKSIDGVDILPSNLKLSLLEAELPSALGGEWILSQILEEVEVEYDYILIDTPPSMGYLVTNAICAADTVIIPTTLDYYSSGSGVDLILETIFRVKRRLNRKLEIDGILFTKVDQRLNLTKLLLKEVESVYGDKINIFDTVIRASVKSKEAVGEMKPVIQYAPKSTTAVDYTRFVKEYLND